MPFARLYDDLHDHHKTRRARKGGDRPRDAAPMGLWALALSWCKANYRTDGFVPEDELDRWDTDAERLAQRLVDAGFWYPAEREGESGFQFHQWEGHQETAEKIEAVREATRLRMQERRNGGSSAKSVRANSGRSAKSVRDTETETETESGPRKRATQLPDDFTPNDTNRRIADERGLDLAAVVEQWSDFHRAKGSLFKDWHAALNTWLRREQPTLPATPRATGPRLTAAQCDGTDCQPTRHEWTDRHRRNRFVCAGTEA